MAKNKITMRDIAKACGVSVATVSYVLSHSEKEKISHETRLNIMKTASDMHYVPSILSEKTLKRKSNLVGIIINLKAVNAESKLILYYDLAAELSNQVRKFGFEALLISTMDLEKDVEIIAAHSIDAVFMIDADSKTAQKITRDYYVPIIFIDCEVNDSLFCKIYPNYPDLFQKAKGLLNTDMPFLMMEDICNQNLKELITGWFQTKDVFINVPGTDFRPFLQVHKNRKGIVLGDILALQAQRWFDSSSLAVVSSLADISTMNDTTTIFVSNRNKAAVAVEALKNMLCLDYKSNEGNRIMLECEL